MTDSSATPPAPNLYVCERGFILVGRPRPQARGDDPLFVVLDDVAVVRRWGTEKGLGQLAREGPLAETILDPEPDGVRLRLTCVYREIPCDERAWRRWTTRR